MSNLKIYGGNKLEGEMYVHGSKNAALPILAGTILSKGKILLKNVPDLSDVNTMLDILKKLGAKIDLVESLFSGRTFLINTKNLDSYDVPIDLVKKVRSSVFLMGPILAALHKVTIAYPGGCEIGKRPIDLHIKGLMELGAEFILEDDIINGKVDKFIGKEIELDYPSVGATENIIMASVFAKGKTIIKNAAKEPEIIDLQNFLNAMGANIYGAGTEKITVIGVDKLKDYFEYSIMSDRIVAGTIMSGAAITNGNVTLKNILPEFVNSITDKFVKMGCEVSVKDDKINIRGNMNLKNIEMIKTLPYPGFPTDMQPQLVSVLSICSGKSIVHETVFENRFKYINELNKMGTNIKVVDNKIFIEGVKELFGNTVYAKDLRGGASLVIAGLRANGITVVKDAEHIDRGYENLEDIFNNLGADITRFSD